MIKILCSSIILIVMLLVTSCASSEKPKAELLLKVVKIEINAWLNLMPGVSPGRFHLTGEVTLISLFIHQRKLYIPSNHISQIKWKKIILI